MNVNNSNKLIEEASLADGGGFSCDRCSEYHPSKEFNREPIEVGVLIVEDSDGGGEVSGVYCTNCRDKVSEEQNGYWVMENGLATVSVGEGDPMIISANGIYRMNLP